VGVKPGKDATVFSPEEFGKIATDYDLILKPTKVENFICIFKTNLLKMKAFNYISALLFLPILFIGCKNKTPKQNPALATIDLKRGDFILCYGEQFGEVNFSLSCDYSVRETFDLALALLHSFKYNEAEKAFVKVLDADPECAMAYLGIAMSIYHAAWFPPTKKEMIRASKILEAVKSIDKGEKENDYIEAIIPI